MVEVLIKVAGSLFIGGLGLALILASVVFSVVLFRQVKEYWDAK